MNVRMSVVALASMMVAPALSAQIGHVPQTSPYIDLEYKQEFTLFGGFYNAGSEKVGVAPGNGPTFGARYELRLGGPASLMTRFQYVQSTRTVIDPRRPEATRVVEANASWPIYLADIGIAVNLTGQRSYKRFVPFVNGGLGVATDFKNGVDVGAWKFGTPFAFNFGSGVKWVSSGKLQVRADFSDHLYQIKYPSTYYVPASDGSVVLNQRQGDSDWTNNLTFSLGISYLFFR